MRFDKLINYLKDNAGKVPERRQKRLGERTCLKLSNCQLSESFDGASCFIILTGGLIEKGNKKTVLFNRVYYFYYC